MFQLKKRSRVNKSIQPQNAAIAALFFRKINHRNGSENKCFFFHERHQFRISGSGRPLICICLYIHCQFSGVTSPPSDLITEPPLHDPTLQHSSSDNPLTNPYKKPLAKRSPAPVASTAFVSPIAGTRTICHTRKV